MTAKQNGSVKANKEKKPKAKKMTKDAKQTLINDKIDELMTERKKFYSSVLEWEEAHAQAAVLKKTMESRQASINGIVNDIDAIRSGNYTPPLPFGDDDSVIDAEFQIKDDAPKQVPGTLKFEGDPKKVLIADIFKGQKRILAALADADIRDVKELNAYTDSGKRIEDIKGMGPGLGNIVAETMINFWSQNMPSEQPA